MVREKKMRRPRSPLPPKVTARWDLFPVNTGKPVITCKTGNGQVKVLTEKKRTLPEAARPYMFKPGQSGNPEGGRRHNPAIKALKKITLEVYREIIELVLTENISELERIENDPQTPAIQVGAARAFRLGIQRGDWNLIEQFAARLVGKIPDELNVRSQNLNANLNGALDPLKVKAALKELEEEV